jgi:hypothetical protein
LEIVRKSVSNLSSNLANGKSILQGFFREIIRSDYSYDRLVEAAVDVFDKGYEPSRENTLQFKIREIRKSDDFRDMDWYMTILDYIQPQNGLHGNFESLFTNDYIRKNKHDYNPLLNAHLNESLFNEVIFSLDSIAEDGKEKILCIGINPKNKSLALLPFGSIYIRERDNAILQMEAGSKVNDGINIPFAVPGQPYMHKTLIKYKDYKGKMYLSLLHRKTFRFEMNKTKASKAKKENRKDGNFYAEYIFVTNEIITEKDKLAAFRRKERQRQNIDLYSEKWKYNENFWKNYNTITERPLEPIIKKDLERERLLDEQFKKNN